MSYTSGEILLNKYKVEACLGRGVFSEAYQVTDLADQAYRTLKVLNSAIPGLGSGGVDSFLERFQFEVSLSQKLNPSGGHNLIQAYAAQRQGGLVVLEREYAPGGSLDGMLAQARLSRRPISVVWSIKMTLGVADALAVLHTHGVVHRDLHPRNILFSSGQEVKLADMYLAHASSTEAGVSSPAAPIPFSGPAGYMSPEQEHPRHKLQPSSDIYSLGLILFETLTGESYAKVKPGSPASSLRADLPEWLDELVLHMLSHAPEDRPYDGAVLAALLRAGLDRIGREGTPEFSDDTFHIRDFKPHEHLDMNFEPREHPDGELSFNVPVSKLPSRSDATSLWAQLLNLLKELVRNPASAILGVVLLAILIWIVIEVFVIR